jgi:hypothetical protein
MLVLCFLSRRAGGDEGPNEDPVVEFDTDAHDTYRVTLLNYNDYRMRCDMPNFPVGEQGNPIIPHNYLSDPPCVPKDYPF